MSTSKKDLGLSHLRLTEFVVLALGVFFICGYELLKDIIGRIKNGSNRKITKANDKKTH